MKLLFSEKEDSDKDSEFDKLEESAIHAFSQTNIEETDDKKPKDTKNTLNLPSPIQEELPPLPKSRPTSAKLKKSGPSISRSGTPVKTENPPTVARPEQQSKPVSNISKAIAKRKKGRKTFDEKPLFDAEMLCFMHEMRERGQL